MAVWWALQTVTTVGYGDVVPAGATGKVIGGIEMVLGVSFISFLTAGVTSAVIQRSQDKRHEEERAQEIQDLQRLIETLGEIRAAIDGSRAPAQLTTSTTDAALRRSTA